METICITYKSEPERDRWVPGDRWIRPGLRRVVRGRPRPGGIDKVFINLCLGLDRLGIPYEVNKPFSRMRPSDLLGVLGRGRSCVKGYARRESFVAGIGLMTHPSEWPTIFEEYPLACYLQHSDWTARVYREYFGDRCPVWPVGIDTVSWDAGPEIRSKQVDFLIYDKIHWDRPKHETELTGPIRATLDQLGMSHEILRYGSYTGGQFRETLFRCKAAIFLSAHESQGIACEEALSSGVPVLAWDPGFCQDPERFKWGSPTIATTSVPYFDERCGRTFLDFGGFKAELPHFLDDLRRNVYKPRDYILENLTVERCSRKFVDLLREKLR